MLRNYFPMRDFLYNEVGFKKANRVASTMRHDVTENRFEGEVPCKTCVVSEGGEGDIAKLRVP